MPAPTLPKTTLAIPSPPSSPPPEAMVMMQQLEDTKLPPGSKLAANFASTTIGSNIISGVGMLAGYNVSASQIKQGGEIASTAIEMREKREAAEKRAAEEERASQSPKSPRPGR